MSKDNVKQMFGKMEKDAEFQKKYTELMQAHLKEAEKALNEKLIELGKTSGFAFSKDDLMAARAELVDKLNSNKELSDGDLANVAGGNADSKKYVGIASLMTLGTACAVLGVVSLVHEAVAKDTCAGSITLNAECALNPVKPKHSSGE